jgi:hypothetical protein
MQNQSKWIIRLMNKSTYTLSKANIWDHWIYYCLGWSFPAYELFFLCKETLECLEWNYFKTPSEQTETGIYFLILLYYCYTEGNVTFAKVLTIYHSWIHPSIIFLYLPSPQYWNSFNRSHYSIFMKDWDFRKDIML